jgi:hypothetical protein
MPNLSANVQFTARATLSSDSTLSPGLQSPEISRIAAFTNGVLAKMADVMYAAEPTIASGANLDLDLAGSLVNALGITVTNAKIAAIVVAADPANTTVVTMGAAASNPYVGPFGAGTHTIKLGPNAFIVLGTDTLAGIGDVVAGTGDILRFANAAGASAKVKIMILGRSA